jgi:hypothetical protein
MFSRCDKEEFELFVGVSRKIWFRRNTVVHGGDFLYPNTLIRGAFEADEDYKKVHINEAGQVTEARSERQVSWKPPPEGKYKLNQGLCEGSQGSRDCN